MSLKTHKSPHELRKKISTIKAIYFDLDGTLLPSDRQISARMQTLIKKIQSQGLFVSIATGRTFRSAKPYIDCVKPNSPLILFNGSRVVTPTGDVLSDYALDQHIALRVIDFAKSYEVVANCYHGEDVRIEIKNHHAELFAVKDGLIQTVVDNLAELIAQKAPTKLLMISDVNAMNHFEDKLRLHMQGHSVHLVRSEPELLEALQLGVSKGTALHPVAKTLGIKVDEIMVFGDGLNDREMISEAGLGIAMGNAHQEVQKAADFVCGKNDDEGIAIFLEQFFY